MEFNDAASSSNEETTRTPAHTSIPDHPYFDHTFEPPSYSSIPSATVGVCPRKDATFVIRDPKTHLVITLKDGLLRLRPGEKQYSADSYYDSRGSHWVCVENENLWLGFRSAVSRAYIGHDNNKKNWRFYAKADVHDGWEWFCAREHPEGGHVLLVKHNSGFRAMKMGGENNRELVVAGQGESGTPWEFILVGSGTPES
ncbi:hypothetical protein BDW59DRAFT_138235 [Aspergillus cavernicola]|uniref:Ricin B lectin domain-containing protein n=1 Tax=Aspergillus cavernicola TaxID=176166 RepID=A0ABR4J1E8_9EURO